LVLEVCTREDPNLVDDILIKGKMALIGATKRPFTGWEEPAFLLLDYSRVE
jgi:hypothetical protein